MRILVIASLFPPNVMGGAEVSAWNLSCGLRDRGHSMSVLTSAKSREDELRGEIVDGIETWRIFMPRPYQMLEYAKAPFWKKVIWHLQDHLDPRNKKIVRSVIEKVRPEFINIHIVVGLGYNTLSELAKANAPTLFILHDLGLACVNMSMFRNGKDCAQQCALCKITSKYKWHQLKRFQRLGFSSPSQANLDRLTQICPISSYPTKMLLNPNRYPTPSCIRSASKEVRILYVGRLQKTKGVNVLFDALVPLAQDYRFSVTVVGSGPDEAGLRTVYGHHDWCHFTGHVTQLEVSNYMANSDVLCVPSVWRENSPGVAIQALLLGLPVMGSDTGGIPELVDDGVTGQLIPVGDVEGWRSALRNVFEQPSKLEEWRSNALAQASRFEREHLLDAYEAFMQVIM